jgi:hypothetical protein
VDVRLGRLPRLIRLLPLLLLVRANRSPRREIGPKRNARQIVAAAVKAACEGDWRAGAWLYERVYGKPEQRVEVETPGTLSEIAAMTPRNARHCATDPA